MSNAALTPLEFLPLNSEIRSLAYAQALPQSASRSFGQWFEQQLTSLNHALQAGEQASLSLASGNAENLHQVMLKMEEAKLALQLAVQVRNKVLEAYQDVLRIQV